MDTTFIRISALLLMTWPAGVWADAPPDVRPATPTTRPAPAAPTTPRTIDSGTLPDTAGALTVDPVAPAPVDPVKSESNREWVIAPIPGHNPSQGFTLGLLGQLIMKDPQRPADPPSMLAIVGFGTQEGSYGVGGGYMGHLDEDRWRLSAGGMYGRLQYSFYGIGTEAAEEGRAVDVDQESFGLVTQITRRISPEWYVGPRFSVIHTDARVDAKQDGPQLPDFDFSSLVVTAGLIGTYDTRDNIMYPTRGVYASIQADFAMEALGSDFDFQSYQAQYNQYLALSDKTVLALRGFAGYVDGNPPFFELNQFGRHYDLRGYESGRYRDQFMFSTQAEVRHMFNHWFGMVAFAGVGEVAGSISELNTVDLLPAAGVGLRFRIAKENPVDFSIDFAYGEDGTAFYLYVGEAF